MPVEIIYYKCALCGCHITKEQFETDASFCEECDNITLKGIDAK